MNNKTICFVTTGDIKTIATSKRALGLANHLNNLGWNVYILMADKGENRHRVDMECSSDIHVIFQTFNSAKDEVSKKNKEIKNIQPDYLYICGPVFRNMVKCPKGCKMLIEHAELQSGFLEKKGLKKMKHLFEEYYSIIKADGLLNASVYLQKVFKERAKKVFKGKLPMLYYPYAYSGNTLKNVNIDYTTDKFKRFNNKKTFIFLGTVTRNYGVFTIMDAIKKLKDKYDNFQVCILGRGRHFDEAKSYVQENNLDSIVFMPGFIEEEEISEYFSMADAFISPMNDTVQDWARCPSKLYMYLPYKKPIITCKIGEPYEVLKDEGLYYEPGNSSEMAERMQQVINGEKLDINIDPLQHEWKAKAIELDKWIKQTFNK